MKVKDLLGLLIYKHDSHKIQKLLLLLYSGFITLQTSLYEMIKSRIDTCKIYDLTLHLSQGYSLSMPKIMQLYAYFNVGDKKGDLNLTHGQCHDLSVPDFDKSRKSVAKCSVGEPTWKQMINYSFEGTEYQRKFIKKRNVWSPSCLQLSFFSLPPLRQWPSWESCTQSPRTRTFTFRFSVL